MSSLISATGVMTDIMSLLPSKQQQADAFKKADADGNGVLDSTELQTFLNLLVQESKRADKPDPFQEADLDRNGSLDSGEVQTLLDSISQKNGSGSVKAESLISLLDSDGDGVLNQAEFANGRQKVEELLGLPPIQTSADGSTSGTGLTSPSTGTYTSLMESLLASYLGDAGNTRQSSLLSLLA